VSARLGLATGYDPALGVREFARAVRQIDERGWEIAFFSETVALMRDSVTALAAFAAGTTRVTLGCTQVVRLRSPVLMAQTIASLDELSGGRVVLCPGACTRVQGDKHGLEFVDPPQALREWIDVIRRLLTGERVSYEGKVVRIDGVQLGWKPVRARVPLWVAATSATGLAMAGAVGDGVLLNTVASPEYSANAIQIVRRAVEAAGRDWASFEIAQLINTSVEDDRDLAIDAVRWEVATKFLPGKFKTQAGPRVRVGEPYIDPALVPGLEEAHRRGGPDALARALPATMVQGLTAAGTPDEVVTKIQRYRDAGVKLPIVRPAAGHQTQRILDLLSP
jgi:5,10-methylenetetrahydromethanopterin reductase